jgi:uncharacterized protein DUF4268
MYDRKIKEEFWITFGKYMAMVPSASGEKINWINYKTGIKNLQFKLTVDDKSVALFIDIAHPDLAVQRRLFQQFKADKVTLVNFTNNDWKWEEESLLADGRTVSRLFQLHAGVNVYFKADWPVMISFLKHALTGLDQFWNQQKDIYGFIAS